MVQGRAGSWAYPEPALFKLMGVPLFPGSMYPAVGRYIVRVIGIFDMRFARYPPLAPTFALALAICVNFLAHHYLPDIRLALFAATILSFARTRVWLRAGPLKPMPVAALQAAFALWLAENVGTATGTWLTAGQVPGMPVNWAKLGSWYLLLCVAFVIVTVVSRSALQAQPLTGSPASAALPASEAPPPAR